MRNVIWGGATLLLMAAALHAADNKNNKPGSKEPIDAAKSLAPGDLKGTVVSNNGSTLVLSIEIETLEPQKQNGRNNNNNNSQVQRQQRELREAQQRLARARNPQEQMRAYQQLLREMQQNNRPNRNGQTPFRVVKTSIRYEIDLDDSVVYRTTNLPQTFDEKGELKKPTAEEIKKLKGDNPRLPGYTASAKQAGAGAEVQVHLARNRETENKLRATMVLIAKEGSTPEKGKKK